MVPVRRRSRPPSIHFICRDVVHDACPRSMDSRWRDHDYSLSGLSSRDDPTCAQCEVCGDIADILPTRKNAPARRSAHRNGPFRKSERDYAWERTPIHEPVSTGISRCKYQCPIASSGRLPVLKYRTTVDAMLLQPNTWLPRHCRVTPHLRNLLLDLNTWLNRLWVCLELNASPAEKDLKHVAPLILRQNSA